MKIIHINYVIKILLKILIDKGPFWCVNEKTPLMMQVKKSGLNCTGLANLVRRHMGLQVPGKVTGQKLTLYDKK